MFDDPNLNKNNPVPGNLPVEDIFAGVESNPELPPPIQKPLATIPSISPKPSSAVGAGVLQPKQPVSGQDSSQFPPPTSPIMAREARIQVMPPSLAQGGTGGSEDVSRLKGPSFARNILIAIIVLVGVGVLGGGSWLIYISFIKPPSPNIDFGVPQNEDNFTQSAVQQEQDVLNGEERDIGAEIIDDAVLFGELIDTDGDNLDDEREYELGTNPDNWDTDGDGLSDGDEVIIWQTDPLNVDTDGDSYPDGSEVKNGYNPAGEGKIFELPQ